MKFMEWCRRVVLVFAIGALVPPREESGMVCGTATRVCDFAVTNIIPFNR